MFSEKDNIENAGNFFWKRMQDKICPKCNTGEMKRADAVVASDPHKYAFKCNNCGNIEFYTLPDNDLSENN